MKRVLSSDEHESSGHVLVSEVIYLVSKAFYDLFTASNGVWSSKLTDLKRVNEFSIHLSKAHHLRPST